jgi:WD40 repeat protein
MRFQTPKDLARPRVDRDTRISLAGWRLGDLRRTVIVKRGAAGASRGASPIACTHGRPIDGSLAIRWVSGNPDEQTLVAATDVTGEIIVWDLVRRAARMKLRGHLRSSRAMALSPDGQSLAWADRWKPLIEVWDLRAGRCKLVLEATECCFALAFSPDGSLIAGVGRNLHRLKAWDTRTGHERRVLDPEIVAATAIAFSADGRLLATCGNDSRIRLWDLASGRERLTLATKGSLVVDLRFSRDSTILAARELFSGVEHWDLTALSP